MDKLGLLNGLEVQAKKPYKRAWLLRGWLVVRSIDPLLLTLLLLQLQLMPVEVAQVVAVVVL
jgi:hypothetical protein